VRFWQRWTAWVESSDVIVAHWLRAARDALLGEMPILAGGTALYTILAAVPTLAAVVASYGVIADPSKIQSHLDGLETILPADVVHFVAGQLEEQARRSDRELGVALAVSLVLALFSARGAARALIDTLNRAYRVRERRKAHRKLLVTIAMAGSTVLGLIVLFAVVVALPAMFALLELGDFALVGWLRWPIMMALVFGGLMLLYRFGPSPRKLGTERHLWPGAAIATGLLLIVSWGLSQWVYKIAAYNIVYGTFGSVVVLVMWFYLSVISIVVGGFVNAELERHAGAPAPDRSMY
jgi:membrane protein